jgi:hypothetical protein
MDHVLARVENASVALERFTLRLQNAPAPRPPDRRLRAHRPGDVERATNLAEIPRR